jgi:hypothetical protein
MRAFIKVAAVVVVILSVAMFALWYMMTASFFSASGLDNKTATRIAKTGIPMVNEAIKYYQKNGIPPTVETLRSLVHDPRPNRNTAEEGDNSVFAMGRPERDYWWYAPFSKDRFEVNGVFILAYSLNHDESLKAYFDGKHVRWKITSDDPEKLREIFIKP